MSAMDYYAHAWLSLLLFIPALIGLLRLQLSNDCGRFMIIISWLQFASVICELWAALAGYVLTDIIFGCNLALYVLLMQWQRNWRRVESSTGPAWQYLGAALLFVVRIVSEKSGESLTLLALSIMGMFLSLSTINQIWFRNPFHLSRNSNFIIVLACLLHYMRLGWMECCWIFNVNELETVRSIAYTVSAFFQFLILLLFCKGMMKQPQGVFVKPWLSY